MRTPDYETASEHATIAYLMARHNGASRDDADRAPDDYHTELEEVKRAKEAVSEFEHELTEVQEGLTYWQSRLDCVTEYRRVAP